MLLLDIDGKRHIKLKNSMSRMAERKLTDSERIEEGQVLVRTIIEMLGAPQKHIEETMEAYIKKMQENPDYEIVNYEVEDAEEQEHEKHGTLYATFAEFEIWFKDLEKVVIFCFDSLPSSIEILEPETLKLESRKLSGLLNDLQAKIHHLDMALKTHKADIQAGGQVFSTLVSNFIGHCIKNGDDTAEKMVKVIGIEEKRLLDILKQLEEKKVIHKKGESYVVG